MTAQILTQARLKEFIHYNQESGVFTWKPSYDARRVGKIAGWIGVKGYREFRISGRTIKAHRAAFLYMGFDVPEQVDHINHCRDDNRWKNLRCASQNINMQNKGVYKNNKSGCTGVSWRERNKKWVAQIQVNKKRMSLGEFTNKEDAIMAVNSAHIESGFHENHGK